jgi:arylsulfatase A-like enzyme
VDLAPTLLTLLGLPLPEDGSLEGAPVVAVDAAVSSESFAEP